MWAWCQGPGSTFCLGVRLEGARQGFRWPTPPSAPPSKLVWPLSHSYRHHQEAAGLAKAMRVPVATVDRLQSSQARVSTAPPSTAPALCLLTFHSPFSPPMSFLQEGQPWLPPVPSRLEGFDYMTLNPVSNHAFVLMIIDLCPSSPLGCNFFDAGILSEFAHHSDLNAQPRAWNSIYMW